MGGGGGGGGQNMKRFGRYGGSKFPEKKKGMKNLNKID